MITLFITIILIAIAAVLNAYMDKYMIQYMLLNDIEKLKLNPNLWSFNPSAKWENGKYGTKRANNIILSKLGIKTRLLADNCNDAWHTFKSLMIVCLITAISIYISYNTTWLTKIVEIFILGTVWNISFNITYKRII